MKHLEPSHSDPALSAWLRSVGAPEAVEALGDLLGDAAVFFVDGERRVLYWSPGAEHLLGFPAEEVLGEHCLKSNRCASCMQGCGIAERQSVRDVPLVLHDARGAPVRVRKTGRAFFDEDGAFAGGIEILVPDSAPPAEETRAARFDDVVDFHGLISRDPAMRQVFEIVRNVATTDATVLVRGESGSGKELVARAIHEESHRREGPFVAVNCAALAPTLLESELFGHVKGAFTGAVGDWRGLFREADGGTLFLDEVAELQPDVQAKLLRVLEVGAVVPVGGSKAIPVDVRLISATHRSLRDEVAAGRFREDLLYRLRVVPLDLPTLRERRRDVELLLWHFVDAHNRRGGRRIDRIAPEAMRALLDHAWPGNVRELRNVVDYAFAVGRGPELACEDLPPEFREEREGPPSPPPISAEDDEAERIREALRATGGRVGEAAERLGMSRVTLWRRRKKHGL